MYNILCKLDSSEYPIFKEVFNFSNQNLSFEYSDELDYNDKINNNNYDYILILNFSIIPSINYEIISKFVTQSIELLNLIDQHAICCPSFISKENIDFNVFKNNTKNFTYIDEIPSSILLIKKDVLKNFFNNKFIIDNKIDWNSFARDINQYGYQALRICNFYLQSYEASTISHNIYDFTDLLNRSNILNFIEIGVDLSFLDDIHNGTSEYSINIIDGLIKVFIENNIIYKIILKKSSFNYFNLEEYTNNIIYSNDRNNYFFKTLFIPQQLYKWDILETIHSNCFQFAYTSLDVIALRNNKLVFNYFLDFYSQVGHKFSSKVFSISKSSAKDTSLYYNNKNINNEIIPILITTKSIEKVKNKSNHISDDYILIIGNGYKHKALELAIESLHNINISVVIIGDSKIHNKYKNKYKVFISGELDQNFIDQLYVNSKIILFPSFYEGFGLPVIHASKIGKKIIVFNSNINKELSIEYGIEDYMVFFSYFNDIPQIINTLIQNKEDLKGKIISRTWIDVGKEIASELVNLNDEKIDVQLINERVEFFNFYKNIGFYYWTSNSISSLIKEFIKVIKNRIYIKYIQKYLNLL